MNNIELRKLDLVELNSTDLQETNGGSAAGIIASAILLFICVDIATNPISAAEAFMQGWNAYK